ncbi:hypothetical protein JNB62_05280 [Microbacterium jejuense]|uniref:Uncharacterized protein n=1 Tax=Microbacterium jejuense TaxID=1263637 RepID=A0ABS7HLJ0_9MICO|nr:hypothetical protein [Microbacterium jejuense]MBW9093087.1 hypothetical protein [Microbacterium jejuense]
MTDPLDDGAQLRCPNDGILMRDIAGGWECPECGHTITPTMPIRIPQKFDGPSLRGW